MGNKHTSQTVEACQTKNVVDTHPIVVRPVTMVDPGIGNFSLCRDQVDYDFTVNCLILGDSAVGKTSMRTVLCSDEFTDTYKSTVGLDFSTVKFRGSSVYKVALWDSSGDKRYQSITYAYYKGTRLFLVMFDLSNIDSFEHLSKYLTDIQTHGSESAKILLIGNKSDLPNQVTLSQIQACCFKDVGYIEISLKTRQGLPELINKIGNLLHPECDNQDNNICK